MSHEKLLTLAERSMVIFVSEDHNDGSLSTDTTTLGEFVTDNEDGLSDLDVMHILEALRQGIEYKGGGGAAGAFTIKAADEEEHASAMPAEARLDTSNLYAACNLGGDYRATVRTHHGGHLIARLELYGKHGVELAHKFSASQELLDSLKHLFAVVDDLHRADDRFSFQHRLGGKEGLIAARAAIAKAEGRAP